MIEVSLYRLGSYWLALLFLGLLLLAWAMSMDARWTAPLLVKQRKWLIRFGWGILVLVLLALAARSCIIVDPVRYEPVQIGDPPMQCAGRVACFPGALSAAPAPPGFHDLFPMGCWSQGEIAVQSRV